MAQTYAPELEAAIERKAQQQCLSRDEFIENIVRKSVYSLSLPLPLPEPTAEQMGRPPGGPDISEVPLSEPIDEWEKEILSMGIHRGVSLSDTINEEKEPLLRPSFVEYKSKRVPKNEWEAGILSIGRPCGVALSDEALTSEEIYD